MDTGGDSRRRRTDLIAALRRHQWAMPIDQTGQSPLMDARHGIALEPGSHEYGRRRLEAALLPWIADVKWGDAGRYRIAALLDAEVKAAVAAFEQAAAILPGGGS